MKQEHEKRFEILLLTENGNYVKVLFIMNGKEVIFQAEIDNLPALEALAQMHDELKANKIPHEAVHCTDPTKRRLVESIRRTI